MKVTISTHPVLQHKLCRLRDKNTPSIYVRQLVREITLLLGYEATMNLETKKVTVETPGGQAQGEELKTKVALLPIMRAGIGMTEAMLDVVPTASVYHIGESLGSTTSLMRMV